MYEQVASDGERLIADVAHVDLLGSPQRVSVCELLIAVAAAVRLQSPVWRRMCVEECLVPEFGMADFALVVELVRRQMHSHVGTQPALVHLAFPTDLAVEPELLQVDHPFVRLERRRARHHLPALVGQHAGIGEEFRIHCCHVVLHLFRVEEC
jgi:hypothetical protein